MKTEIAGALASRTAGIMLIIVAASMALPWMFAPCTSADLSGGATAGWTSYSPLESSTNTVESLPVHLDDIYYATPGITYLWLPYVFIAVFGVVMILLSKPLGRLLARGLNE